jgi:hypothetical protein
MRKLWPPKVKGVINSKKIKIEQYKRQILNTQKVPFMLFCYYYSSNVIGKTSGGAPIEL